MIKPFSFTIFWNHPAQTLAFVLLVLALVSLWIRRTPWIWGTIAGLAFLLAYRGAIVRWESLIPIAFLLLCFGVLAHPIEGFTRLIIVLIAVIVSMGLTFHFIPGFKNWRLAYQIKVGTDSTPYNLWWNFDKPLIGLIILGLYHPLLETAKEWGRMFLRATPIILVGLTLLIYLAFKFHFVQLSELKE